MSGLSTVVERLTPKQRELLLLRMSRANKLKDAQPRITRRSQPGVPLPLSFAQQRLWFLDQLDPGSPLYNIPTGVRLTGALNHAALARAVTEVVRRHEALRTSFSVVEEQPVQIIALPQPVAIPLHDLTELPEAEREEEAQRLATTEAQQPFNLATGPLLRVTLLRLRDSEHVILVTMHHIVSDGWSMNLLIQEMTGLYGVYAAGQELKLPELAVQYADYALWQREWLAGGVLERELGYWREQLAGAPAVLEMVGDRPRPPVQSFGGAWLPIEVPADVARKLKELTRRENATLFMTLLAAFKVLLWRYSGQTEIVVGTPIAGRQQAETESLIGLFVNTLVLRTRLEEGSSFRELLGQVREVCLGGYAHQDVPFEKLVEELQPERSMSHSPLFQVMFNLQAAATESEANEVGDLQMRSTDVDDGTAKYDLTLSLVEGSDWLNGILEFNIELYDSATMQRLVAHFCQLLTSIVADAEQLLFRLRMLTVEEEQQLLIEWNQTGREYPQEQCIHELFSRQAALTPEAVALVCGAESLSYRELERRSNQLARYLSRKGVGPEVLVGILVERSVEMVVGLLGVLKAGGAYVPLDAGYPRQRLQMMVADSGAGVVLTQARLQELVEEHAAAVVCLDADWELIAGESAAPVKSQVQSGNLAYVIYTSGSTGQPKGVMVTHRNVANFLSSMKELPGLTTGDVLLAVTTLSFDIAGLELYLPLIVGACVVVASREVAADGAALMDLIEQSEATTMQATPATWQMLVEAGWLGREELRVFCGGEALNSDLARQIVDRAAALWNLYGPTETTIWSALHKFDGDTGVVPIGRPLANTQIYLLDSHLCPVPVGVAGELYIGGAGLARGYYRLPALTAERFIPHPFSAEPGACMYRTGDLARYRAGGSIEFLGRIDHQVKIRSFRIELGEIEAALASHEGISQAVVIAREDVPGDKRLVAYVIGCEDEPPAANELRQHLRTRLPEYMIPTAFVTLAEMPLTPNSKLDRRALPAPDGALMDSVAAYVAPRTPTEELLVGIWAEVLRREQVGVADNFFELGGHSLLATQMMARARKAFQIELPLNVLFEAPTVMGLAGYVEGQLRAGGKLLAPPIEAMVDNHELPLSFAQQRLWFLDQLEPGTSAFNMPAAVRLRGRLDLNALEQALSEVMRRHEVLRTVFVRADEQAVQVVKEPEPLRLQFKDISYMDEAARDFEARRQAEEEARHPFDLAKGPLLRTGVVKLGEDEHLILLTMHHIISDGWSMSVLIDEIVTLYWAFSTAQPSPLPELAIQYADYAAWQRQWLQGEVLAGHLDYWKQQLQGVPVLELPTDRPRPPVQTFQGKHEPIQFDAELARGLQALSRREGATLFMTLLAAWQLLLSRYTGQEDICVGSYIANRNRVETEGLIGYFINNLAFRTDFSGNPTFRQLVGRARKVSLDAYLHQDVPFEMVLEALHPQRDASRTRLFQVTFVLQNTPASSLEIPDMSFSSIETEGTRSNFDLTLWMWESPNGLAGSLEYSTALFDASSIQRMIGHFTLLLEGIVANADERIGELPLLGLEERRRLLVEWNDNELEVPQDEFVHELFEAQAAAQPEAVAVVFEDTALTYGELNARANQLAHYLQSQGVRPESRVGICMERSVEMVVGLLGVLKAGGAYVPLDPAYPKERLAFMMADAQAPLLLTQQRLLQSLPAAEVQALEARAQVDQVRALCIDADAELLAQHSTENLPRTVATGNLAYLIYTSGSTQRPRAAMISHGSLTNAFAAWEQAYSLSTEIKCNLQTASFAFDVFTGDVVRVMCSGGKLVICPNDLLLSAPDFYALLRREQVECIEIVPAILRNLTQYLEETNQSLDFMRLIVVGADALYVNEFEHARQLCGSQTRLVNTYGLTEATIDTSYFEKAGENLPAGKLVPIGRPFANTKIYILDRNYQPVPTGVAGELHVGGPSLARGYLKHPELTATKFIPHPFSDEPGARLYRTGDLAHYLPDGNVAFLGRNDYQVKVRGFRIELEEIETTLLMHGEVRQAVVVAHESAPGQKHLVAYIVAQPESDPSIQELRQLVRQHLPAYMVPVAFVKLDAFPLTPNGKVNRRQLPAPDLSLIESETTYIEPGTEVEQLLAEIWSEVLGRKKIGVLDNFFETGGHSLLATQVVARVRKAFNVELPLRKLFETPTIAELAITIEDILLEEIELLNDDEAQPQPVS